VLVLGGVLREAGHFGGGEAQGGGRDVGFQVAGVTGAGDCQDMRPALEGPGEADLRRVAPWASAMARTSPVSGADTPLARVLARMLARA
jgi:hypothetical protein